jgi:putative tricarboxylic transport membrane protein
MNARKEISASLALLVLGIGYLIYNAQYSMGTWGAPGPAVFPFIVGSVFVLLSLGHMVRSVRQGGGEKSRAGSGKPLALIVLFILHLFLMKGVGFYMANLLFVIGSSRLIGARDWIKPLALAVGINLFCYLLFEVWLKVSLPKGLLL